jgi:hypothetical protein
MLAFVGFCLVIHSMPLWFIASALAAMVDTSQRRKTDED